MEIRQYVFERLNTGGERLNAQEIRNCLYASSFNNILIKLARGKLFTKTWNIPPKESTEPHKVSRKLEKNPLYSKMADCEIVLRYFALSELSHFKSGMKRSLDDFMIRGMTFKKLKCDELETEYNELLELASNIYGEGLFRLSKDGALVGRRSVPLADAILIALHDYRQRKDDILEQASNIVKATLLALDDPAQYELLVGRGNTKRAIEERINLMKRIIATTVGA